MWMEANSSLPMCTKASLSLQASLFAFSAVTSHFPQLLKCDTDMVVSYPAYYLTYNVVMPC